ncbi:hypothetical protein QFW82_23725 [Streptomyces malaysiensis subsp. malaysiensis]|uniref:DUF6879 family protein n=1 Tax=Streptomyces malaysiensis TaxID=92644 RepID=UPI0024C0C031|nr:DUF6879 family protein [Streptomyces sp. NA07423]WHX19842.1 hypothetical protein QFW82_23725 [Streptomyces sp. NA07423]
MPSNVPSFEKLLAETTRSAVHLEMRDSYYNDPLFEAWKRGERIDWNDRSEWWIPFYGHVADAVARGVRVRRARVVSEPVSDYIRWEHYVTKPNIDAGEEVRWLPRRGTTDLLLPGNDFWIFDDWLMRVHHFAGNGDLVAHELADDASVVKQCASAFEQVWKRAVPHETYEIR